MAWLSLGHVNAFLTLHRDSRNAHPLVRKPELIHPDARASRCPRRRRGYRAVFADIKVLNSLWIEHHLNHRIRMGCVAAPLNSGDQPSGPCHARRLVYSTAVGQRGIFDPSLRRIASGLNTVAGCNPPVFAPAGIALRFFVFTEQGRHLCQIMVVAVHIAGLIWTDFCSSE